MISKKIFAKSFIFSMFILLVIGQVALGQDNGIQHKETAGLVEITTNELVVKVTASGTVPHFHFWNPEEDGSTYHVMFLKLFEVNDTDEDGIYNKDVDKMIGVPMALPVSNWELSEFDIVQVDSMVESIHFNFTTHVNATNLNEMKFDLIISGWDWQQEDSLLVFQFTVSQSAYEQDQERGKPENIVHEGNKLQFGERGEGYFEYAEEAQAGNLPIQVRGSSNDENEGYSVYLAFEYFGEDTLVYDPTLGISAGVGEETTAIIGSSAIWIGLIGGISIGLVIITRRIRTKI